MERLRLYLTVLLVSLCGAAQAQPPLTGRTWTGGSCLVDFLFDDDGRFGEYNDDGGNHYGQWEMDGEILYLVYDDMSYQKAEVRDGVFSVYYYDDSDEPHTCEFSAEL